MDGDAMLATAAVLELLMDYEDHCACGNTWTHLKPEESACERTCGDC